MMLEPNKFAIYAVTVALYTLLSTGSDCYAAPSSVEQKSDDTQETDNRNNADDDYKNCPDTYRKFKTMEKNYHRPQLWQGCNGAYDTYSPTAKKQEPKAVHAKVITFFKEHRGNDTQISGLSYIETTSKGFITGMAGLHAEKITSPKIMTYSGRQVPIYSLYGSVSFAANQPISPYAEVGVDLGGTFVWLVDALLRDALDQDNCVLVDKKGNCTSIDTYYAIGLQSKPKKYFPLIRGYAKWYSITYDGRDAFIPVFGLSVGWSF